MKARTYPVVLSLACACLLVCVGRAADTTRPPYFFVDPADPVVAEIRQLGESTINNAGKALVVEVRQELETKSAAVAVGAMHLKNYKLPAAVPGKPVVTAVRRTSVRLRNPANAPDAADQATLDFVQRQLEQGDPVSPLIVQKVQFPNQPVEWRVYRPFVTLKQCVECHGTDETLAPGVVDALKLFFPSDQARDYRTGEWRGLMRVSIALPREK